MTALLDTPAFRPPAPKPREEPPGMLGFLLALRRDPLTTWTERHFREKVTSGEGILGRIMVVNDPAIIRHVLVDNAANYRKDDLQLRILAPGLGRGLLTAEGEDWRLQRRTIAPLFNPRNVATFFPAMVQSAERLVRRWERRPDGRVIDVTLDMTRITLDVLERTIFTSGISRNPDALGRAITRYFEGLGRVDPVDIFGLPAWVPRIGHLRARPAIRFFEEMVRDLIAARKALLASGRAAPQDLLTLLLQASDPETGKGLSDADVNANIVTFIGAGHETTANALSWSLYLISQDERVRTRIEAEVDEVLGSDTMEPQHIDRLVYTRAVLDEAMRLYPPAPFLSRAAIAEDAVGDVRIEAGTLVTIAPYVLHRHQTLWDEPDSFRPERFLPEARSSIDRFAYLPFGAGPRVCIGASFALQEAVIVLASIVRAVRLDLAEGHVVTPLHRITLRPRNGLRMSVRSRPRHERQRPAFSQTSG